MGNGLTFVFVDQDGWSLDRPNEALSANGCFKPSGQYLQPHQR
jgi:hypothetical protein